MPLKKQFLLGLGVIVPIILIIAIIKYFQVSSAIKEHSNFKMPPEAVTTTIAKAEPWREQAKVIGTLAPAQGAMLGSEVIGRIAKINVESGQDVEKGAVLIELDTTVETANLKESQARLERGRKKVERYDQLKATKAISPEELDNTQMEFKMAQASVQSLQSIIERKNIVAPFAGRIGIRQVNVGQTVMPGAEIIPLISLDPLFINFTLPQQLFDKVKVSNDVSVTIDAFKNEVFTAKVTAIDPNITESTRNFSVQATLPNPTKKLAPGMFVSALVDLPTVDSFPVVPSTSINYAPYGDSVYIVEELKDDKGESFKGVRQQMVQLGAAKGDLVQIISGVKDGSEVVSSGVFKLRPNAPVLVNNSIQPSNSKAPNPADQ